MNITKQELQQYQWLQENIRVLEDKLLELETTATKITPTLSDMPRSLSDNFDKITDIVQDIIKVKDKINRELQLAMNAAYKIECAISKLPEREKYLIRSRYIEGKSWEEICVNMNYSWRQVHRIHSNILNEFKIDKR